MKMRDIENKMYEVIEQYARGEITKAELENSIYALESAEDEDDDALLNIFLYMELIEKILVEDIPLNIVKKELLGIQKLIIDDMMLQQISGYNLKMGFYRKKIKNTTIVYFDQNLFSQLLRSEIEKEIVGSTVQIVYSPAHIEELYKADKKYHKEDLQKIKYYTDSYTLRYVDGEPTYGVEPPIYPYKRVEETCFATELAERLKVLEYADADIDLPEYNSKKCREIFNGQCVESFFDKFEKEADQALMVAKAGFTIAELKQMNEPVRYNELNGKIHSLYKAMDLLGFKKDKIKTKGDGKIDERKVRSSRHDIEHLLYAANADIFITADKNLYYRAINIFQVLKKRTQVRYVTNILDAFKFCLDMDMAK